MTVAQSTPARNPNAFYAPRSPLESAAATLTTERGTYYADCICLSTANSRTSKHSVAIRRASDRAVAPATNTLIVKSTGYSSVANVGSWPTYKEAVQALLERGVQWFESKERVA